MVPLISTTQHLSRANMSSPSALGVNTFPTAPSMCWHVTRCLMWRSLRKCCSCTSHMPHFGLAPAPHTGPQRSPWFLWSLWSPC
ncbi:rCG63676 [Rattus norvegicus]|uniref:RCG63676 n=1 Tax=Rattus norvegicus TaxID=10116 RepID=A6IED5_RAT|nr:rCG63676 [Rattus norvegicus]